MSSQYNLASDNVTNSRNVQHSLSTPPLTPKPNCNIDVLPSDQNNANGKRICRNIQQNPAIGHALQVDIGNSQANNRKNTKCACANIEFSSNLCMLQSLQWKYLHRVDICIFLTVLRKYCQLQSFYYFYFVSFLNSFLF